MRIKQIFKNIYYIYVYLLLLIYHRVDLCTYIIQYSLNNTIYDLSTITKYLSSAIFINTYHLYDLNISIFIIGLYMYVSD